MKCTEKRLNAFATEVDDRFDQLVELIEYGFRTLYRKMDEVEIKIDELRRQ